MADPRAPKVVATIPVREGWHSHTVRVAGDIMIVNQEKFGKSGRTEIGGGIDIYDVSNPHAPKLITEWRTVGGGVHRFDFDGDLYGRHIRVEFVAKLRDEEKFDSLDALTAQMRQDADNARTLLESPRPGSRPRLT